MDINKVSEIWEWWENPSPEAGIIFPLQVSWNVDKLLWEPWKNVAEVSDLVSRQVGELFKEFEIERPEGIWTIVEKDDYSWIISKKQLGYLFLAESILKECKMDKKYEDRFLEAFFEARDTARVHDTKLIPLIIEYNNIFPISESKEPDELWARFLNYHLWDNSIISWHNIKKFEHFLEKAIKSWVNKDELKPLVKQYKIIFSDKVYTDMATKSHKIIEELIERRGSNQELDEKPNPETIELLAKMDKIREKGRETKGLNNKEIKNAIKKYNERRRQLGFDI